MLGVGIGGVRAQFEACRWDCRISSPVRGLESGLEEFEAWSLDWWSSSRIPTLGVGIEGVRAQFKAWRLDWRSLSPVRGLQSGL